MASKSKVDISKIKVLLNKEFEIKELGENQKDTRNGNYQRENTVFGKIVRKIWGEFCKTSHNASGPSIQTVRLMSFNNRRRGEVYEEGVLFKYSGGV